MSKKTRSLDLWSEQPKSYARSLDLWSEQPKSKRTMAFIRIRLCFIVIRLVAIFITSVAVQMTSIAQATSAAQTRGLSYGNSGNNPPNFILILVDDAALQDFGVYGGEAFTPNIDKLAHQGTMFTNYHSSLMCAPARAMLLTGCDSHLAGVPNLPVFLAPEHTAHPNYDGITNRKKMILLVWR